MSAHPDPELLAAHADGCAPAAERAGLEAHLGACPQCRKEVAGFKAVSKLVADLPQAELPTGFMARLERRRRQESAPAAGAAFAWPGLSPLRLAGFAATGLLVCLVFFREVRYRLAPQMLGDAAFADGDSGIQSRLSVGLADEADVAAARQAAAARGAWQGLSEEAAVQASQAAPAPQAAPAEADAVPAAGERREVPTLGGGAAGAAGFAGGAFPQSPPQRARLKAGGMPLGAGLAASNEQLQAHLEAEKARMGIQEIVPPGGPAPAVGDGLPDRPLSKDEAMDYMRTMTRSLTRLNRDANAKKRPTVDLGAGATPRILGAAETSQPLDKELKRAAAKPSGKADAGSLAMVRGAKGARVDEPASFEPSGTAPSPPALRRAPSMAAAPAAPKAEAAARAEGASPAPRPLTPRGFWSSTLGGPGSDGGAVITKAEDWADLWRRVGRAEPLPAVDFAKEMAVAVFAARDEESRRSVEVVSLSEESGALVIRYRLKDEGVKAPSAPYHVVVAPKSELPFEFVLVK